MADKTFRVVLSYDVQVTSEVQAKDEEEAEDKVLNQGEGKEQDQDWEYRNLIETEEV